MDRYKVYRVELFVLDTDDIGPDEVKSVIENVRYPNHCISPDVVKIDVREVEWSDDHPLNNRKTFPAAYAELFK